MDLELGLLGGLTVRWQGNDVAVASAAARALLARLALDPARAVPRDELARLLWPERTQAAAFTNLRQTLARLRHAVPAVIADRARVGLVEGATSDVARFADLLAECAVHDHPAGRCERCIARRAEAARLYRGEFATGLELLCSAAFDDWLLLTREHLRYRFVELLDAVGDDHATAGEHTDAAAAARRQLDLEPWREGSHRRLMRALADAGDRAAALAQYVRCVQMLDDELGVAPDPATTALRDRIRAGAAPAVPRAARRSEVPDPGRVHGREAEIAAVAARLAAPEVRVVSVLGLGGVGKTTVAAAAARAIERDQDILVWRSLLNAPPPEVLLAGVLPAVGGPGLRDLPDDLDGRLDLLLDLLAARRCVLVLDNLESVLDGDGRWRPGHAGYGQLLAGVATADLSSAVLLTSREQPPGLDGGDTAVHTLRLTGLDAAEGRGLLAARGLVGPTAEHLVARYSGHPLALRLVSRTVQELFAGDLDAFLAVDPAIFDDVRSVLDELWERLSGLERLLLATLAVAREPLTVPALRARLRGPHTPRDLVEAVAALRRRSVVEVVHGRVGLQNVILEYLTARIVECACTAVTDGDTGPLDDCALLDPGAVEHVRDSQSRLVVGALAERLTARLGRAGARTAATGLLARTGPAPGYAAGTLVNLAVALDADLTGADLSGRAVWHADLRGATLVDVDLRGADLTGSAFTEPLGVPRCIALCPAGRLLAVGTDDGDVRVWHLPGGELARVLAGDGAQVLAVAFAPDGAALAAGRSDGAVRVWDAHTGALRWSVPGDGTPALGMAFGPDGTVLAVGGPGNDVVLRDAATGGVRRTLRGPSALVTAVAFTPDGAGVMAAGLDHDVHVWEVATGRPRGPWRGHADDVFDLAVDPRGRWLASCAGDGELRVWDLAGGATLRVVAAGERRLWAVAASPDGALLAVTGVDRTIGLWDTATWEPVRILHGHGAPVRSVVFGPGSDLLVSSGFDQTIRTWDVTTGRCLRVLRGHTTSQLSVRFVDGGARVVAGGMDGVVRTWDAADGRRRAELRGHRQGVTRLAVAGGRLASASGDRDVRLWDRATGTARVLRGHRAALNALVADPDGMLLASADDAGVVRLWDAASGAPRAELASVGTDVLGLGFGRGPVLYAAALDGKLHRFDPVGARALGAVPVPGGWLICVAVAPDGVTLAVGSGDGAVRLVDPASGEVRATLTGHAPYPVALAFTPDGATLASAGSDGTARIWDVATGRCRHVLRGHRRWVFDVDVDPSGATVATAGADGAVRLWDVADGTCRATFVAAGPYAGMAVAGVTGITPAQWAALLAQGAVAGPPG